MPAVSAIRDDDVRAEAQPFTYDLAAIRSLMRALADRKAGRVYPLSEIKAEFGIR